MPMQSPLTVARKARYPGQRFLPADLKMAGKIALKNGEEAALDFLKGKSSNASFQPPAKGDVIAMSRPLAEWPAVKASVAVQKYVFSLSLGQREDMRAKIIEASRAERSKKGRAGEPYDYPATRELQAMWLRETGVNTYGFEIDNVQGMNKIFQAALNTYDGVFTKAENRNKKRRERIMKINERRAEGGLPLLDIEEERATDEAGFLLHPPGVNMTIWLYQQVVPRPFRPEEHPDIQLPAPYAHYHVDPDAPIPLAVDRLSIAPGEPGHVPQWQRDNPPGARGGWISSAKSRRRRQWWAAQNTKARKGRTSTPDLVQLARARAQGALLVCVRMRADWAIIDVRGLLRSVRYRAKTNDVLRAHVPADLSLKGLLSLFSRDAVIDPRRNTVTFLYDAKVVGIRDRKPITKSATRTTIEALTAPTDDGKARDIALVAVDLGQTNPLAAKVFRVGRDDQNVIQYTDLGSMCVSTKDKRDELGQMIAHYRTAYDDMQKRLRREALSLLSTEQQTEYEHVEAYSNASCKDNLAQLGVDLTALPWGQMTGRTTFISDYLLEHKGDTKDVFFTAAPKKKAKTKSSDPKRVKRTDFNWARFLKPRVSKDTRTAYNEALFQLQRESPDFRRLSKRKEELARRLRNTVLVWARSVSQCSTVGLVLEDLNVRMMSGRGKYTPGWEGFFQTKHENRWFIQPLYRSLNEFATHQGGYVFHCRASYTSITCPACGHCHPDNRSSMDREHFHCLACGRTFHADRDVAPLNLLRVALSGQGLPGPGREQGSSKQKARPARKVKN